MIRREIEIANRNVAPFGAGSPMPLKRVRKTAGKKAAASWPMPYTDNGVRGMEPGRTAASKAAYEEKLPEERPERDLPLGDSINIYFREIKRFALLKAEEERALAIKVSRGDKDARKKMIESNLRLAVNIAKRYLNRGFPLQDLIDEGNIGLIKAVERFKPTMGCRFSTYATYWIKQTIERALANQANIIRLPIHITTDMSKVARASREFNILSNRDPSLVELCEKTGLSGRYVKKLDMLSKRTFSLESLSAEGAAEQPLVERLEDERVPAPVEFIEESRRVDKVGGWLNELDDNERKIISMRFGFGDYAPKTLDAIGKQFGVTRERVRQIEEKALGKLKVIAGRCEISSCDAI